MTEVGKQNRKREKLFKILLFWTLVSIICILFLKPNFGSIISNDYSKGSVTNDLHLTPPSHQWIEQQINRTMAMLNYKARSPPNKWICRKPRHTYYFPKIKTIFTGIPKSGSSNWEEFLMRAEGTLNVSLGPSQVNTIHKLYSDKFRLGAHSNTADVNKAVTRGETILSFAVVRNPWTRLVSGYRDKLSGEVTPGRPAFRGVARRIAQEMNLRDNITSSGTHPTFNQYLRWLLDNPDKLNDHFTPQYLQLCIPSARYDFVIPLEYSSVLNKDINHRINTTLQLSGAYDSAIDPRLQSLAVLAREWLSQQDQQVIDRLYLIYKADFALMDYSNFSHPDFPLPMHRK